KFSDTLSDAAGSVVLLPVPGGGKPPNYKVGDRDASFDAADAEVLELGVVEDAVFGALASHAGLLHPTERRDLRRDDAGVEPDDPVLERLCDAPRARQVARVEIRREAELGVVRHAH